MGVHEVLGQAPREGIGPIIESVGTGELPNILRTKRYLEPEHACRMVLCGLYPCYWHSNAGKTRTGTPTRSSQMISACICTSIRDFVSFYRNSKAVVAETE